LLRGIKTLAVRVQRQNESALRIAVSERPSEGNAGPLSMLRDIHSTTGEEQMAGAGGVLSFEIDGTGEDACA